MATIISLRNQIAFLLLAVSLTAVSYFYLDNGIALLVYRLLSASELLSQAASEIPDLLLHIVVAITVMSWAGYFFLRHRGVGNRHTRFFQVCGTAMPIAFVTKTIFQYVFGRSDPQAWVLDHELPRFYWFQSGDGYGCFPSGHMTVFTALMTILSRYYPRYRPVFLASLFLLALALIATDYHFLSDVLAGAWLGAVVAILVDGVSPDLESVK